VSSGILYYFNLLRGKMMNPFSELKQFRTLLVDDDELIRDALSIAFTNKGCFLRAAETAEEGLQALEQEPFDIVISDLRLPGIDGLEFIKQSKIFQPDTVSILITAYRDKDIVSEASAIGVHNFIEKPFSVGALVESLAMMINNRKSKLSGKR